MGLNNEYWFQKERSDGLGFKVLWVGAVGWKIGSSFKNFATILGTQIKRLKQTCLSFSEQRRRGPVNYDLIGLRDGSVEPRGEIKLTRDQKEERCEKKKKQ